MEEQKPCRKRDEYRAYDWLLVIPKKIIAKYKG